MIYIASDHGGFELKQYLLEKSNFIITDLGCYDTTSVDYPNIANKLCLSMNHYDTGIIICGTGIGVSITCNRHRYIRCALCHNYYTAEMARKHNDANILALGGRVLEKEYALEILKKFLSTEFEGGRHEGRIKLLS